MPDCPLPTNPPAPRGEAVALSATDRRVLAFLGEGGRGGRATSTVGHECFAGRGRGMTGSGSSNPFTLPAGAHLNRMQERGLVFSDAGQHGETLWTATSAGTRALRLFWINRPNGTVVGCIDAHGAIVGRATGRNMTDSIMHGRAESAGKRWRWNVHRQEWGDVLSGHGALTAEEQAAVQDWLIRRDHADESSFPPPGPRPASSTVR